MPAISSRADPSAVADVSPSPAVNTTPTPNRVERRLFSRTVGDSLTRFAVALKTNAQWIKQFLHGGK